VSRYRRSKRSFAASQTDKLLVLLPGCPLKTARLKRSKRMMRMKLSQSSTWRSLGLDPLLRTACRLRYPSSIAENGDVTNTKEGKRGRKMTSSRSAMNGALSWTRTLHLARIRSRLDSSPPQRAAKGSREREARPCPSYNQVRSSGGTERTDSIRDRSALAKRQLDIIELE